MMELAKTTANLHRCYLTCGLCCAAFTFLVVGYARGLPPVDALPAPDYSFDAASPSVIDGHVQAADGLSLAFPHPAASLPGAMLGLYSALDDLDALSAANGGVSTETTFAVLFSVDRLSTGGTLPAPQLSSIGVPFNATDQSTRGHAAGDQFATTKIFRRAGQNAGPGIVDPPNNSLIRNNFDEGGTDFAGWPPTHADSVLEAAAQDRVDATARLERSTPDGPIQRLYFSVAGTSPSLEEVDLWAPDGASGANIYFAFAPDVLEAACCYGDASCSLETETQCAGQGGSWLGPGSSCEDCTVKTEYGACCTVGGSCFVTTDQDCEGGGFGGTWMGPDSTCASCDAWDPSGACCLDREGSCVVTTPSDCNLQGNDATWLGEDTDCLLCLGGDLPGACCTPGRGCLEMLGHECLDGVFFGPGTTCDMCNTRDVEGACCSGEGVCTITIESECGAPGASGTWMGPGTDCDMCEEIIEPGACCYNDGTCAITPMWDCLNPMSTGIWMGPDTTCEVCDGIPLEGACCMPAGSCQMTLAASCDDGYWLGYGSTCDMCLPEPSGACCLPEGGCLDTDMWDCLLLAGRFLPDRLCTGASPDGMADGACLDGVMIVYVFASYVELGLLPDDDIDALTVFDINENGLFDDQDQVLFSLAPGSPSLTGMPGLDDGASPADILIVASGDVPRIFATAAELGLTGNRDNIDAMDILPVGTTTLTYGPDSGHIQRHSIRAPRSEKPKTRKSRKPKPQNVMRRLP